MYTRYIPQPDGSYRRSRIQEAGCTSFPEPEAPGQGRMAAGFDTEDLIVVLLVMLMSGPGEQDRQQALLTLVLYFLM